MFIATFCYDVTQEVATSFGKTETYYFQSILESTFLNEAAHGSKCNATLTRAL